MKKRFLGILMAMVMVIGLMPATAFAEGDTSEPKTIYLKGNSNGKGGGSDSNDGSSAEKAVLTLKKALELAGENGTIIVEKGVSLGYSNLDGELVISNVTIERGENNTDELFVVTGNENEPVTVTLKDVRVDGKKLSVGGDMSSYSPLFQIQQYATLNIQEGAELVNNASTGVVVSNGGEVSMTGGEISGNTSSTFYAAGVYIFDGVFEMGGGEIKDNVANCEIDGLTYGMGGGVGLSGGTFKMTGGKITGNEANYLGGGIYCDGSGKLELKDGEIAENNAVAGDAILMYDSMGSLPEIEFSGSLEISGDVYQLNLEGVVGNKVKVTAAFTPIKPVYLVFSAPSAGDVIAEYAEGLTPNAANFTTNITSFSTAVDGQNIIFVEKVDVEEVILNMTTVSLETGKTETLIATVSPDDATDKTVTWTSSDPSVATVENGVVTAVGAGTAIITAQAGDCMATCTVTVTVPDSDDTDKPSEDDDTTPSKSSSKKSKRYDVDIEKDDVENGSIDVNTSRAKKGSTVTITVTPDEGYELDELIITDKNGDEIEWKDKGNGKFTFTMPRGDVEIEASFKEIQKDVPAIDADEEETLVLTIDSTIYQQNGEYLVNDVAPVIKDGSTMLPIRLVAEFLGADVTWNEAEQTVTITKDDITIIIYIGQAFALVNGEPIQLDAPAFIENGRTYLPLRFIAENLNAEVIWDDATKTVKIIPEN